MFSTQPEEFPGVVPNAIVYSCSLVRLEGVNMHRVFKCYFHIQSI